MIAANKTRLTAAGNIKGRPGMLHWLIVTSWYADPAYVVLNDDTDGTDDEIAKFYVPGKRTVVFPFDPPIPCAIGIRIGTFSKSNMEVTGGYS